jgi:DNA-binding response OmpR family regulator
MFISIKGGRPLLPCVTVACEYADPERSAPGRRDWRGRDGNHHASATLPAVIGVLLATDSDAVYNEVDAALAGGETTVWRVRSGAVVLDVIRAKEPELVLLDLQIGNMGGLATCLAIRQEEGFDRMTQRPVGLLLDRTADVFLAGEARADGWLVKPLDPLRLRRLATRLLAGETFHDDSAALPARG